MSFVHAGMDFGVKLLRKIQILCFGFPFSILPSLDLSSLHKHQCTVYLTSIYLPQIGHKFATTPDAQTSKFYGCTN
jgi:hypothetical protein